MFDAITILGILFLCVALCDKRAWPHCLVVAFIFALGNLAYTQSNDYALIAKIPLALVGGFASLAVIVAYGRYERWSVTQPFFFMAELAAHYVFWFTWARNVDLWTAYAHGLNALFLGQLFVLAIPGAGNAKRILSRWARLDGPRRFAGSGACRVGRADEAGDA
jgi:hypothetical protein